MTEQENIFKNINGLRKIASIEALVSEAAIVNKDFCEIRNNDLLYQEKILDDVEKQNVAILNQINKLKLHLKEAEITLLKEKIEGKSDIISKFDKTKPANVNTLLSDIRLAIKRIKKVLVKLLHYFFKIILSTHFLKKKNILYLKFMIIIRFIYFNKVRPAAELLLVSRLSQL